MRNAVVDYAIPRDKYRKAKERDEHFKSAEAVSELLEQAKRSFTDLARSGEGGEMLLFLLAERFLGLPQILCKMDLKTDTRMHYHGADGVYASVSDEGLLNLFWGESKIYSNPTSAIRDCLVSLAPFLLESDHEGADRERDLLLLSDKADLSNPKLTDALRKYFDRSSSLSTRVKYCGIALVGFDVDFYGSNDGSLVADQILKAASDGLVDWREQVGTRIKAEKLELMDIQLFCLPLPSAEGFREAFSKALGYEKG